MRTLTFASWPTYPLVFLVPALRGKEIQTEYLDPFGISPDDVKCIPLHFKGKKTPVKEMRAYIEQELVPYLQEDESLTYLVVADAGYFKVLSGLPTAEPYLGYVVDCKYGPWKLVYVPSFRAVFYDPEKTRAKIAQAMQALTSHAAGTYQEPGTDIIHFEAYPETDGEIQAWLDKLLAMNRDLAIDIEAFDLKHHNSGIGTISFAWSKHEGIAFPVDYVPLYGPHADLTGQEFSYGVEIRNEPRRKMLREFFTKFLRKAIYHNITFDVYILIYQLFMNDLLDQEGMLHGMSVLLRNWDCTRIITYLATNSCAGNELGLKSNSQEFSGNYSVDEIEDITRIPLAKLLRYNLIDALSTWYVKEKHEPVMDADQQREIYETLFRPAVWDIVQMQLTGLPLNKARVEQVKSWLEFIYQDAKTRLHATQVVQEFTYTLREMHVAKRNATLKKKRITMEDAETLAVEFNPNSGPQLQALLYEQLELPVLDLTKNKQPAVGTKTLEKLQNHTTDPDVLEFFQALIAYNAVDKLLTSFIPAFEQAPQAPDGWHYLYGFFKLGGAVSGRLSSSDPNLQNLPANVVMSVSTTILERFPGLRKFMVKGNLHLGNLIKWCFQAPPGWVLVGLDFNSLEDMISALTTKDPNKLKVYIDGYDGHSLRAYSYWSDLMPDIDPNSVESINSIQVLYPVLRQKSKAPTFAKTYRGTWRTLVKNCGFSEEEAKRIEANYDKLYSVSIQYIEDKLDQASRDGYITAAFGLRVRTPLLAQVVRGSSKTPFEAEAEGRTAGNALGQSWCMLNDRAGAEFLQKVRASEHRLHIRPCARIHDAQYFLVREDITTVLFVNEHLVKAVQWQDHPDIYHPVVKLGGRLSLFWPDWSHEIEIPNNADEATLMAALAAKLESIHEYIENSQRTE